MLLSILLALSLSVVVVPTEAFSPCKPSIPAVFVLSSSVDDSNGFGGGDDSSSQYRRQQTSKMSIALPFMECPPVLRDCDLAGNRGFDPLGLAVTREQLLEYREAEVKHIRISMLAAAGWPLSELFDRKIAAYFDLPAVLDSSDRAPSLLNGGLERVPPEWWGFCLGFTAAIDMYGISKARAEDPTYVPGKLGFDPLGLYPKEETRRRRMEESEIVHGRLSMIAVALYALLESFSKMGVVDETPFLFKPMKELIDLLSALQ